MASQHDRDLVDAYLSIAEACEQFSFFELGAMFAPFGHFYSLSEYEERFGTDEDLLVGLQLTLMQVSSSNRRQTFIAEARARTVGAGLLLPRTPRLTP